ncbi:dockerin type I repeat-containing protein, partial [archaeon]|nr:dockerin type I repeat-containing protein [archaeon]
NVPPANDPPVHVSPAQANKESISTCVRKEGEVIWKVVLLVVLIGLILAGISILLVKSFSDDGLGWFPDDIHQLDGIPPKISLNANQNEWVSMNNINISCNDTGIDFSSGCDHQSYVLYLSQDNACPKNLSLYSQIPKGSTHGFLCAAAKDIEGNTGYSQPVTVKFDTIPPMTSIEQNQSWIQETVLLKVTDSDKESGLYKCYYSLYSNSEVIQEPKERSCNQTLQLPIQSICAIQGEQVCTVNVYSTDNAGNTGKIAESSLNIDFDIPKSQIISVSPSNYHAGQIVVSGIISIKGTATDANFKQYSLKWERSGDSQFITTSTNQVFEKEIGILDTSSLSTSVYTLVLTVEDLSGKKNISQFTLNVSNENISASCALGEQTQCSQLQGVCSSSIRNCRKDFTWGECEINSLLDYELVELNCGDNKDNDCDGHTDNEDTDCNPDIPIYNCSTTRLIGDINGNNQIDTSDALIINDLSIGLAVLTGDDCCADVNSDGTIDENDVLMVNNFVLGTRNCFPAGYSCDTKEHCSDTIDNDCDSFIDELDPDCGASCIPIGSDCLGCSCGLPCCGAGCDPDGEHCFECVGSLDSVDGKCEADGCSASASCDEQSPGMHGENVYECCDSSCQADVTLGSAIDGFCTCSGSDCSTSYCFNSSTNTCYTSVSCLTTGWNYGSMCITEDDCSAQNLQTGKTCTIGGCSLGISHSCSALNKCENHSCGELLYYCTFDNGWEWRLSIPEEVCDDGIDNDCDNLIDTLEDPDCTSGCNETGQACLVNADCCSNVCDSSEGTCIQCSGPVDITNEKCEHSCGASANCDEVSQGEIDPSGRYCCMLGCTASDSVGMCNCDSGTCDDGYCWTGELCYYGMVCSETVGWNNSGGWDTSCNDFCLPAATLQLKECQSSGCIQTDYTCNESNECSSGATNVECDGDLFNCHYSDSGAQYQWYIGSIPYGSELACSDTHDNDCDNTIDSADSDCGGTTTTCLEGVLYYIHYQEGSGYQWYGEIPGGSNLGIAGRENDYTFRMIARWNLTEIPDEAIIENVTFKYDCSVRESGIDGRIVRMVQDPSNYSGSIAFIFSLCKTGFIYVEDGFPLIGPQQEINLGDPAMFDVTDSLGADWFSIAMHSKDELMENKFILDAIAPSDPKPSLCISYTT